MATSIPKNTPVPMSRLAAEPGPEASTRGTSPSMNASDVITIGRKRSRAAVRGGMHHIHALVNLLFLQIPQ